MLAFRQDWLESTSVIFVIHVSEVMQSEIDTCMYTTTLTNSPVVVGIVGKYF